MAATNGQPLASLFNVSEPVRRGVGDVPMIATTSIVRSIRHRSFTWARLTRNKALSSVRLYDVVGEGNESVPSDDIEKPDHMGSFFDHDMHHVRLFGYYYTDLSIFAR